ncbi:MAG: putative zinc-binding protein [Candidatus Omnitrophota bacterium]
MASQCSCGQVKTLNFSCSGGSDVGELTDRLARRLQNDGKGKMYCLAGLGAHIPGMIESARAAEVRLVIDGCPVACGKKIFEQMGLEVSSVNLKDLGFEKGKTMVNDQVIEAVIARMGL